MAPLKPQASSLTPSPPTDWTAFARQVLDAEAEAIGRITLTDDFSEAVKLIGELKGSLVISGLGKSGLIGQKLAATFASTGTPSHFMHPVEALHGDIGKVRRGDAVMLLSYTGNTDEVVTLAELLRQDNIPLIAMVSQTGCDLDRLAQVTLPIGDIDEACPLNLAPTASTTAMLALGDALALAVAQYRNFSAEDFRKVHPGGGLGRQLMPVSHAMRFKVGENLPLTPQTLTVKAAYANAQQHADHSGLRRPGALLIVDDSQKLVGIVTDGDLRSALINTGPTVWSGPVDAIMTTNPTTLPTDALVRDAVRIVREHRFDEIPIINDDGKPMGLIDVQDLAALKVIEG